MRLCFDCLLREDTSWAKRYWLTWLPILLWGGGAFSLLDGSFAISAQALFFLATFGWSVWPLFAASRPASSNRQAPRAGRKDASCE